MRWLLLLAVAACGGGNGNPITPGPDAAPMIDAPMIDAPPSVTACTEFAGPGVTVPAHLSGSLAGADYTAPQSCPGDAPFGIVTAGPDSVQRIDGLTAGARYVVRLSAAADLSFYVVDGCDGGAVSGCLLFEDAHKAGADEIGTFVASASTAYVVVDYYQTSPPASTSFTLDIHAESCADASACSVDAPACIAGSCVECATSFDCTNAALPTCNATTHACVAATSGCASDDANAPGDNGPAGAPVVQLDANGRASAGGMICSVAGEVDYVAFDVATVGETWMLALGWSGGRDLDLEVLTGKGEPVGLSLWEHPETVQLTYLQPGRYYARITEYATTPNANPIAYALTATRLLGQGCTSAADCAATYRNQVYRGDCQAGSCVDITGAGTVAEGGACDSNDDCATGLSCPSFYFVGDADTREVCGRACGGDQDCPTGDVCTTYVAQNFCVSRCHDDDDCPTAVTTQPQSGPWYRMRCNQTSGRCYSP